MTVIVDPGSGPAWFGDETTRKAVDAFQRWACDGTISPDYLSSVTGGSFSNMEPQQVVGWEQGESGPAECSERG